MKKEREHLQKCPDPGSNGFTLFPALPVPRFRCGFPGTYFTLSVGYFMSNVWLSPKAGTAESILKCGVIQAAQCGDLRVITFPSSRRLKSQFRAAQSRWQKRSPRSLIGANHGRAGVVVLHPLLEKTVT